MKRISMRTQQAATRSGTLPDRWRVGLIAAVAMAMVIALLPPPPSSAQTVFPDVPADNVHRPAIDGLAALEIVVFEGYDDGTFRPGNAITRGQLASVVARILGLQAVVPAGFSDTAGSTHEGSIGALAQTGIIRGYADGTFRPGDTVRRDHAATIVARWLGLSPGETGPFTDVGGHHAGAINVLERVDVVEGRTATTFEPLRAVTRAQTASLVYRGLDIAELEAVRFLATNDFHGRLLAPGSTGGAAYLSTHLNAIKDAYPNTLHVDAGDLVGATPVLSNLFYDDPTVEAMNLIGLDIQTVGNHEFDRGQSDILRRYEGGCYGDDCDYRDGQPFAGQDFETLSTNVTLGPDIDDETLLEPWAIIDVGGFDVGFLGVTTVDTPTVVHPDGIVGLTFHGEAEAVNEYVPELEAAGVDLIVVLMHEGGRQSGGPNECIDFTGAAAGIVADLDDAVDIVVSGHTHQNYVCDIVGGPLVTSAYQYGQMFTEITLLLDADGEIVYRMADNRRVTQDVTPDPAVLALIEDYQELAGPALREVVGTSEVEIPRTTREAESAQGNLATDALRQQFDGVDFAFQNSGGLRADLTDADDKDADGNFNIRRENVLEVWPFGNTVWIADVDGPTLKAILDNGVLEVGGGRFIQVSGLRIDYRIADATAEPFPRGQIVNVQYWDHPDHADGTPVSLAASATYRIAMNDFMALGGDGYPVLSDDDIVLRGDGLELAVERYLADESPVAPEVEGRIVQLN
jgi:5'-nucleotidase